MTLVLYKKKLLKIGLLLVLYLVELIFKKKNN